MNCPYCASDDTKVMDKRDSENGGATRRRRECLKCGKRFTTYERVEAIDLMVVKKDGRREQFDPEKLRVGLVKACEKLPISMEKINAAVDQIEQVIRKKETTEVPSQLIGEEVMKKLKKLDKVAYIRFASVYRSFEDLESFEQELSKLKKKNKR